MRESGRAPPGHSGPGGLAGTGYVPALDGVRGLAVLAVLGFHGGLPALRGGFLGVDAFFVLSGYLIVSLLLAEHQRTGRIALLAFWGRRARRLLPALLLVVATVAVIARTTRLPSEEVRLLRGDGLAALFYVANWRMILRGGDYFANTAAPSPLEHTWSLGIEEQFYLFCPLLLVAVLALSRRPLGALLVVCVLGVAGSTVALSVAYDPMNTDRAYYGTDTRAGSLLVGVALAVLLAARPNPRAARAVTGVLATAGLVFLGWAWSHASGTDSRLYHGGLLVAALSVAAVLANVAVSPRGIIARALALPPLPAIGLVSYGIYLWHWPVFQVVDGELTALRGTPLLAVRCVSTLVVAVASYVVVERPIRNSGLWREPHRTPTAAAASLGTVSVLVLATTVVQPQQGVVVRDVRAVGGLERLVAGTPPAPLPRLRVDPATNLPPPQRWRVGTRLVVDVFGDSLPWSLVQALPRRQRIDVRDRTILGCGVTLTAPYRYFGRTYPRVYRICRGWERHWRRAVAADDPHVALVMVGRWETMTRTFEGRWRHVGDPVYDAHLQRRLHRAIILAGAGGARVVLATLPYNRRGERSDGGLFPEDRPNRVRAWNRLVRDVAADHPGVAVLDLGRRISPTGRYSPTAGGFTMRTDGLHLHPDGVTNWVAPWLYPRLLRLAYR